MARRSDRVAAAVLAGVTAAAACIGCGTASASPVDAAQQVNARQAAPPAASSISCGEYPCYTTADEVLASTPQPGPGQVATVPLARRAVGPGSEDPRMVAGLDNGPRGYWSVSDGYSQGRSGFVDDVDTGNVYNFDHWQYVDDLYYYTHALMSVPPTQWTNAGHRNGVPVFATVTADCDYCGSQAQILFDPAHFRETAEKLYQYAAAYGFDGWVIDMETDPQGVTFGPTPSVLAAVKDLLSRKLPDGRSLQVIVYQAHTSSLAPDDELLPYIEAGAAWQSDYDSGAQPGPDNPASTTYDTLRGAGLGARRFDAYWASYVYRPYGTYDLDGKCSAGAVTTTTQIWNGNTTPGKNPACLNTELLFANQRLIVDPAPAPAPRHFISAGLFAPEWTYFGNLPDPATGHVAVGPASRSLVHAADDAQWVGHEVRYSGAHCTRSGTDNAVSSYIDPRSVVGSLPFVTNFNEGEGDLYALGGRLVAAVPWNNLSGQDLLPTWLCAMSGNLTAAPVYADQANGDAYNGGSALAFTGRGAGEFGLYATKIAVPSGGRPVLTFVTKTTDGPAPYVRVYFSDGSSQTVPSTTSPTWKEFGGELRAAGKTIVKISVGFADTDRPVHAVLGQLRIFDRSQDEKPSPIVIKPSGSTISWTEPAGPPIAYWNVYARRGDALSFVGPSFTTSYDTSRPMFGPAQTAPLYVIQPVSTSGTAADTGDLCRCGR